jgi:hypothetical protein
MSTVKFLSYWTSLVTLLKVKRNSVNSTAFLVILQHKDSTSDPLILIETAGIRLKDEKVIYQISRENF